MDLAPMEQAQRLETALSLDALYQRAVAAATSYRDHPEVALRETRVRPDGAWQYNGEDGGTAGVLSRHALKQLCERLSLPGGGSVPAGYLARCPAPLAAEHLNHWLAQNEEDTRVLVRTRHAGGQEAPHVRAVLSERYATVDHLPVLEELRELAPAHRLRVAASSLDDARLTLRLQGDRDHPASLEDPLRVGVHVSNSEIGLGRVSVTALITRLVCANGLIVRVADLGGLHRRHLGRAGEDLAETLRAALPRVLEEAEEGVRRFTRLRNLPAPTPLEEYLRKTARAAELPETVLPQLTALLDGDSLFHVVNAFTQLAQRFPVEERIRLEVHMSRFLTGDPTRETPH